MARDLRARLKIKELYRLYLKEKRSLEDIARLYGVSRVAIWNYCRTAGLKIRNRSEARLEAQKGQKVPQRYFHINENFFSAWSSEMAYVLGLLMTDGCLSKVESGSYRISLCLNDKELIEKVVKVMGSEHTIKKSAHQEGLHMFIFGRQKLAGDLIKLGMKPRKSLDLKFPDAPKEYLKDFIRGVFDGDGTVYFEKRSKINPLRAAFVSSSHEFIEGLECALQQLGLPARAIYAQKTKNGLHYKIRYSHNDSKKLFNVMYGNLQNNLYLERKFKKFIEGFKEREGL